MYKALYAKFTQNNLLKSILIETNNEEIIELSYKDAYWGSGKSGLGKNQLGKLLMKIRQQIV